MIVEKNRYYRYPARVYNLVVMKSSDACHLVDLHRYSAKACKVLPSPACAEHGLRRCFTKGCNTFHSQCFRLAAALRRQALYIQHTTARNYPKAGKFEAGPCRNNTFEVRSGRGHRTRAAYPRVPAEAAFNLARTIQNPPYV